MRGRAFLRAARQIVAGANEACWRGAVIHAYYALFLECRESLASWGAVSPPRHQSHNWVRLKLLFARDSDLKSLGMGLEALHKLRNQASYDLASLPDFSSDATALQSIQDADAWLAVLDAIEADAIRRTAAVASLPP